MSIPLIKGTRVSLLYVMKLLCGNGCIVSVLVDVLGHFGQLYLKLDDHWNEGLNLFNAHNGRRTEMRLHNNKFFDKAQKVIQQWNLVSHCLGKEVSELSESDYSVCKMI